MLWWTLWQLKSKDPEARKRAAERLGESKNKRAVDSLATALNDTDNSVVRAAAKALGEICDARAGKPLVAAFGRSIGGGMLGVDKWEMKGACTEAIVKSGSASVEPLVALLKESMSRREVAEVLEKIGNAAVEPLMDVLKDTNERVRSEAAKSLGKIGGVRAVEPLVAALKDSDEDVRANAANALGEIGDTRAVGPLVASLNDSEFYVLSAIGRALQLLGWQPTDDTQRAYFAIAFKEWDKAADLGVAAIEPLIKHINIRFAVKALGQIGDPCAVEPLVAVIKDIAGGVQKEVVQALGQIGDARATQPLVAALGDSFFDSREAIVSALLSIGAANTVDLLIAALKDSNYKRREAVAEALGKIGDERAIGPLAIALKDSDKSLTIAVVGALGMIGDIRATEPLVSALDDKSSDVQRAAAEALGKIKDERALKPLVFCLKSKDEDVKKAAAEALINIGSAAIDPLLAEIKDLYSSAQDIVVRVLTQIGDARTLDLLVTALTNRDRHIREVAAKSLQLLHWHPMNDIQRALLTIALEEWDEAANLGTVAVEPLVVALKDSDSDVRSGAASALGNIGDTRAIKPLMAALKDSDSGVQERAAEALGKLKDIDDDVQNAATEVLERFHYERTVEQFIHDLFHSNEDVRAKAFSALGELRDPRAVKPLCEVLENNLDHRVWGDAAEALGKIGDERAIEPLIAALNFYNHETVCRKAAEALEKIGDVAIGPLLVVLKDGEREVRLGIPSILGQIGDARAVEPLVEALKDTDGDSRDKRRVCKEAAKALVKIGNTAVKPLIAALKDADSNVRARAASALGQIGDARAVEPLVALLEDSDFEVRLETAAALSSLNWQPTNEAQRVTFAIASHSWVTIVQLGAIAFEPLIAAIKDLRFHYQQQKAIWALGSIGDPRAVGPLVTLAYDDEVATTAVNALRKLLESSVQSSSEEDLRAAAALYNVSQIQHDSQCGHTVETTKQIDCSHVRQLARQELIRRGLEA